MRITLTDLRNEVVNINQKLIASGHNAYLHENGRNGYQAVDAYAAGARGCDLVECGSSREVISYCQSFYYAQIKKKTPKHLTRQQCKKLLTVYGVDFKTDFHTLSVNVCEVLATMAKKSKYRKPASANGSTARYFFNHLSNKVA